MHSSILLLLLLVAAAVLVLGDGTSNSLRIPVNSEEEEELSVAKPQPKLKACWKDGESRGRGVLPDRQSKTCPASQPEKSMGLCYSKCSNSKREGFGPLCWDNCEKMVYHANGLVFCCDTDEICAEVRMISQLPV